MLRQIGTAENPTASAEASAGVMPVGVPNSL